MKNSILKVAEHLENGTIDSDKARSLLLNLFGVSGSLQPLTIDTVNKMLKKVSKETWIAVQGDEHGWKEWYAERCKLNLNSNDANCLLPAVFYSEEMIAFGNFIRDNYYVAGSPKMLSYHPDKYPHAKVDEIFVYWCLENGR